MTEQDGVDLHPSTRDEFVTALESLISVCVENDVDVAGAYPVWDDDSRRSGYDVEVTRVDQR